MGGGMPSVSTGDIGGGGSTGDMMNQWGDATGSQMVMVDGGKIAGAVMAGVVGIIAVAGVSAWLIHQA